MKLWGLLEAECHKLDLELAQHSRGEAGDRQGFLKYAEIIQELAKLKDERHRLSALAAMLDGVVTAVALQIGDGENQNPRILELRREAVYTREQISDIVSQSPN